MRLVLHAGFHKTGTSSVQQALVANRAALAGHARIFLKADFKPLADACRAASVSDSLDDYARVTQAAAGFGSTLDPADPRPVLMASEDLSGIVPGRRGVLGYQAAPQIMRALLDGFAQSLPAAEPTLFFSTRAADAWVRSVWWQNLRSTRLSAGLDRFSIDLAAGSDLDRAVRWIRAAVAPVPVVTARLEHSGQKPLGPLDPVLDLLDLPTDLRAGLALGPVANAAPAQGLPEVFLALNRSGLTDTAVSDAKRRLRRAARRQMNGEQDG